MELDNFIQTAMRRVLKNPILTVLKDINFSSILKQSNFIKRDIGVSPYLITLQFLYMFIINKKISTFMKYSNDSFKKDVYYRLLKNEKYNWRKLLLLSSAKLIKRLHILQKNTDTKVLIIDDTVEIKRGQSIEGCCKNLWSSKEKRVVKGVNIVSLNYSDSYTDMMLDFSINYNKNKITDVMNNYFHHNSNANKRRVEGYNGKNILALDMIQRVLKLGIYADYLLVDSWYAKPDFINTVQTNGLDVIARVSKSNKIWQFIGNSKTLESLYNQAKHHKCSKLGNYNSIKYSYVSAIVTHKTLGKIKIVFIKTKDNLIPIISTNIILSDIEIINTYKKRWNIEQGYKDLREYFQFGKEENRIYEALIARITLSFLAYNLTSYINRINNEPQTLGNLFRDLECQLETLAISMEIFLKILEQLIQSAQIVKRNKDLEQIIHMLRVYTKKQLGFMCES
ncbi:transposase [Aliarcobacter butzleri]|uniref:IS4 family transposase n=3 Tax=Arcobacteraceae TaxID=2808963 RepID=UPI00263D73F7|nr:transposase [Aliarcobacter butzleri]MDN5103025.1 transposase [Aliarcobacter butzleri]